MHNLGNAGKPAEMRLCLPTMKGFLILKLEEIIYCEAARTYTLIHLEKKKRVTDSKPLLDYDSLLQDTSFFRVHKSFIVNLAHVVHYEAGRGGNLILSDHSKVEVAQRRKTELLDSLRNYHQD